ncbi:oligosaccharide flippase family protein [Candidatus Gracilibacteria bacterium]|nr:oligosaccharide flippase family protein [Candidatus Gracilibacteria bacterium]
MDKLSSPQQLNAIFSRGRSMLQKGLAGEFVFFATSTLLYQGSRLVVSLIVAAWIGPELFGTWNVFNLVLIYGAITLLGVPNGMNRQVPMLRGSGDNLGASHIADTSFWFSLVASVLSGLLLYALLPIFGLISQNTSRLWYAILFTLWQFYQYQQMRLKSATRFQQMSAQQCIFALLLPLVVLPASWYGGLSGFIAGQAVTVLLICIYIAHIDPPGYPTWDNLALSSLINIGWSIMVAGLLYSVLTSIDRWIIVQALGTEVLGHYTLAIISTSSLQLFPAVISQQLYPRMAYQYGKSQSIKSLIPLIRQQTLVTAAISLPPLVCTAIILPYIANTWLIDYLPGVIPAQILLIGLAIMSLTGGAGNFLNTVGLQRVYLTLQAMAIVVSIVLCFLFLQFDYSLNSIAFGTVGSYIFYCGALWITIYSKLRGTSS